MFLVCSLDIVWQVWLIVMVFVLLWFVPLFVVVLSLALGYAQPRLRLFIRCWCCFFVVLCLCFFVCLSCFVFWYWFCFVALFVFFIVFVSCLFLCCCLMYLFYRDGVCVAFVLFVCVCGFRSCGLSCISVMHSSAYVCVFAFGLVVCCL